MNRQLLEPLLCPIPGDHPSGRDMTHSPEFDEIRKLRKGDDPLLAQGEWVCEIKAPQWARVRELCEGLLKTQTKDLQVACWYTEALTNSEGFQGLALGLGTLQGLLERFGGIDHSALFPTDQDERIARFEWLNAQLPLVISNVPMTTPATGSYSLIQWEESRAVENLGLRDTKAKEQALAEGKLAGEAWDKAAMASGPHFYIALLDMMNGLQASFEQLEQLVECHFAPDSPNLSAIQTALEGCHNLASQCLKRFTGVAPREEAFAAAALTLNLDAPITQSITVVPAHPTTGGVSSRTEAIRQLREIAKYFRAHEPHSPVALLVERAARWGEMSLEHWLGHVIKDENTLGQLHDLLDLRGEM
ncbi:type VI secretion system protein TssA [Holophaga foetida]|uniref:type VI secretion system protein TssA n=1 Tax=Holophaga foetida TaxID=35839 RepID=UPI0002472A69|nr:type VI secretion system protein TssA [Holophaga foetida]